MFIHENETRTQNLRMLERGNLDSSETMRQVIVLLVLDIQPNLMGSNANSPVSCYVCTLTRSPAAEVRNMYCASLINNTASPCIIPLSSLTGRGRCLIIVKQTETSLVYFGLSYNGSSISKDSSLPFYRNASSDL